MLTNKQKRFLKAKTVETGLSDFQKKVFSVFRTSFKKQLKIVTSCGYNSFDNKKFRESLITYFDTAKYTTNDSFENLAFYTLDKMAPIKQNYIRDKQSLFISKKFIRL